jgi:hypothetical protein
MVEKKKRKKRYMIAYEVFEDRGEKIHKQRAVEIDDGFETLCELMRKL